MPGSLDRLKQMVAPLGKGLLSEAVPGLASGVLIEFLNRWHVNVKKIAEYVKDNRSLWADLGLDERSQLAHFAKKIGDLDFITPNWFINSIKTDFPDVASLFLNWPEAGEWMIKQIDELKREIFAQPEQ